MGPSGAGECGVAHRRVNSVHEGWERRKLGGGLERKREDLFPGERGQQGRELHPSRGDGLGEEEIWYLYTKRERGKGRMVSMVESLRRVGFWLEEKEIDQGVRDSGRSYVEVVKGSELRDTTRVRVETKEEEIRNNVSRLKQCLIGKWNPKLA